MRFLFRLDLNRHTGAGKFFFGILNLGTKHGLNSVAGMCLCQVVRSCNGIGSGRTRIESNPGPSFKYRRPQTHSSKDENPEVEATAIDPSPSSAIDPNPEVETTAK